MKTPINYTLLLIGISLVWLSGCATVTRGTTEPYTVLTDPPGAVATFSSGETCLTPCTVEKKRKTSFTVTVKKNGYQAADIAVKSGLGKQGKVAMAGNLVLVGTLVWVGVDSASGAAMELSPNPANITLRPREEMMAADLGQQPGSISASRL